MRRELSGPENLAYACPFCNRSKGSDIGSIVAGTRSLCRFFNPRRDHWEHFANKPTSSGRGSKGYLAVLGERHFKGKPAKST